MATFILIAGTHHGGWYWDDLAAQLRMRGHDVFTPTLTGLDDLVPHSGPINLDTHINDVLRVIDENNLSEIVLVGSSYGGMVITGVSDRTSTAIGCLVYLDAALPRSGQSEWDLNAEWLRKVYMSSTLDGLNVAVPENFLAARPRLMPHPLGTKLQPLFYSDSKFDLISKVYVHAEMGFGPDVDHFFSAGYQRSLSEAGWKSFSLACGHDMASDAPEAVLEILLSTAD